MASNPQPAKPGGKPGKEPKIKLKKEKKKKSAFAGGLIALALMLALLGGAGYCVYTNVGGVGEKLIPLLPAYKTSMAALDKRAKTLADAEAKLADNQAKLDQAIKASDKAAADIKAQQDQLAAEKDALTSDKKIAADAEAKKKAVAQIYATLDAPAAARLLLTATQKDAVAILALLPADNVAAIIAEIGKTNPQAAYELTKLMMQT